MKSSKKFDYLSHKDKEAELKEYLKEMNLEDSRVMFSICANSVKHVKSHRMSDKVYEKEDWLCECGRSTQSSGHLLRCPSYESIRKSMNFTLNDEDIVEYFRRIIRIRDDALIE